MECNAVEWNGMDRRNSMQWSGMEWSRWNAMQWSGMEWIDGMQCSGVEWNGVDGMQCSGVEWNGCILSILDPFKYFWHFWVHFGSFFGQQKRHFKMSDLRAGSVGRCLIPKTQNQKVIYKSAQRIPLV